MATSFGPVVGIDDPLGNVFANGVAVDAQGDIFVTGTILTGSVNLDPDGSTIATTLGSEGFVAKYSPQGRLLGNWEFSDGLSGGAGLAIAVDAQGNPVVAGTYGSSLFVEKYDGQTLKATSWHWFGNSAQANAVAVDGAGNIYLTGWFRDSTLNFGAGASPLTRAGVQDIFVLKLDPQLHPLGSLGLGGAGETDSGNGIALDDTGNVYITGQVKVASGQTGIYVAQISSTGQLGWHHDYGSASQDTGRGIAVDGFGDIYVVGTLAGTVDFGPGAVGAGSTGHPSDLFVLQLGLSGQSNWIYTIGNASSASFGSGLAYDPGHYSLYVTGSTQSKSNGATTTTVVEAQFDNQGHRTANQGYGSSGQADIGSAIAVNPAGKVAMAGSYTGAMPLDLGSVTSIHEGAFVAAIGLQAPVAHDDSTTTVAGQSIEIPAAALLSNDSAPTGLALRVASIGTPTSGAAGLGPDGSILYTPAAGFVGVASFSYMVRDGSALSSTAQVYVDVQAPPPPPGGGGGSNGGGSPGGSGSSGGGGGPNGGSNSNGGGIGDGPGPGSGAGPVIPIDSGIPVHPSAPAPYATGIAGLIRSRKGLTTIVVSFDEALDAVSVENGSYFLRLGVRRRHRQTFSRPVGVESATYDDASHNVSIHLQKPVKGEVQVTIPGGIAAANGAIGGSFTAVVS